MWVYMYWLKAVDPHYPWLLPGVFRHINLFVKPDIWQKKPQKTKTNQPKKQPSLHRKMGFSNVETSICSPQSFSHTFSYNSLKCHFNIKTCILFTPYAPMIFFLFFSGAFFRILPLWWLLDKGNKYINKLLNHPWLWKIIHSVTCQEIHLIKSFCVLCSSAVFSEGSRPQQAGRFSFLYELQSSHVLKMK